MRRFRNGRYNDLAVGALGTPLHRTRERLGLIQVFRLNANLSLSKLFLKPLHEPNFKGLPGPGNQKTQSQAIR